MKLALGLLFSSLAACAAVPQGSPTPIPGHDEPTRDNRVFLYLGQRELDEDEWSPVEEQATIGLEYVREPYESAVGFEVGIMGSGDDDDIGGIDVEAETGEIYGGVHKTFGEDVLRPYVGAGLSFIKLEADAAGVGEDDDASAAFYAHGGLLIAASEAFFVGLDLRFLVGSDLELAGIDTDADYAQLAILIGVGF